MRKIKFRGKIKYTQRWIDGYLWRGCNEAFYIKTEELDEFGSTLKDFEVFPETVGQFTGLTDKNGKEIYENDIVFFPCKRRNFLVMWNDDLCVYQFSDGSLINSGDNYSAIIFVVGNAFDNPELLNEKQ